MKDMSRWSVPAGLGFAVTGAVLCAVLLYAHATGVGAGVLAQVCGGTGGGCDLVMQSRWAFFPPRSFGTVADEGGGIPTAALGFFYFSSLAVWFGLIGRIGACRRWMRMGTISVCSLGAAGSLWFIWIMATDVGAVCPLCLGLHLANFAMLPAIILARSDEKDAFPDPRLVVAGAALSVAISVAGWESYQAARSEAERTEIQLALAGWMEDAHGIELSFLRREPAMVPVREGDPSIRDPMVEARDGPSMTLVYFSDVECAHCVAFEKFLFDEVRPVFQGHLRIVFKHFPLSAKHPNAMRAALAMEAARVQGKFWEMHDYLVERRAELRNVSYSDAALALGLDPGPFMRDMDSPEAAARVEDDMLRARSLGVITTPWVFLECRLVDRRMLRAVGFWKLRAAALRREYEIQGLLW